jgi:hypothetical protein
MEERTMIKLGLCCMISTLALAASTPSLLPPSLIRAPIQGHCASARIAARSDLANVASCEIVDGDLMIDSVGIAELSMLGRLQQVTGTLTIAGEPRLRNLNGLERLQSVGNLVLINNAKLADIRALGSLRRADGITIMNHPTLESLAGLEGLKSLLGLVIVNTSIHSWSGLDGLEQVDEWTVIEDDPTQASARQERIATFGRELGECS